MGDATSDVLEYFPERPRIESSAPAMVVFFAPLIAAAVAALLFGGVWGLPAGLLVAVYFWQQQRRAKLVPQATLRVEGGVLVVTNERQEESLRVALDELDDVTLDTKTIYKVQENMSSGIPDLRFIDSRVGPGIDNSRIGLLTLDTELFLTEFYTSSIDATDWFSKIRRFLRKRGWRPLDERNAEN